MSEEVSLGGGGRRGGSRSLVRRLALACALALPSGASAGDGVVRAVLFTSPTCPHCQKVREEVLPPLGERYGGQLQVALFSTTTPMGANLYWVAVRQHGIQRPGVPLMLIGNLALLGADEIQRLMPALVNSYLSEGGAAWPDLPGLGEALAASGVAAAPSPAPVPTAEASVAPLAASPSAATAVVPQPAPGASGSPEHADARRPDTASDRPTPPTSARTTHAPGAASSPAVAAPETSPAPAVATSLPQAPAPAATPPVLIPIGGSEAAPGVFDRIRTDPRGNGLAILVLLAMIVVVGRSLTVLRRPMAGAPSVRFDWLTPVLALAGLGVAAYLAHVEVNQVEAVCGPVGDCNTVQSSPYARLFGILPIGVLGALGFAVILLAWGVRRWAPGRPAALASVALLALTGLGTAFSIYLTFLEPFVIGATCLWCLSSAVIMTTLYVLSLRPGRAAMAELGRHRETTC